MDRYFWDGLVRGFGTIGQLFGMFTGNLDERATRGVFQLIREINAGGTCVVMATHDLDLVKQATYRTVEMRDGMVVFDSGTDESTTEEEL